MASTERKYDLYSPEFRADPYSVFERIREQEPVLQQAGFDGTTPMWFVTRYDDVAAVLLDDERFVRDPRLALTEEELATHDRSPMLEVIDNHMLNRDGDDHRRLRRLVTKAFTPKVVEQLRPRIQAIADELIDAVEPRREMDLSADYAFPLPITVIAELLGVPNEDQDHFKEWSDAIISPVLDSGGSRPLQRADGPVRRPTSESSSQPGVPSRPTTSSARCWWRVTRKTRSPRQRCSGRSCC